MAPRTGRTAWMTPAVSVWLVGAGNNERTKDQETRR